jgi:hypothetical protein
MSMTVTQLRADLFSHIDHVLATGEPLVIERKGRQVTISADRPHRRLDNLVKRPVIVGDPDSILEPTPYEWSAGKDLGSP